MKIAANTVVTFEYALTDAQGTVLDSSESTGPLTYVHGQRRIVPGLEDALEGRTSGDRFHVVVEPEHAYGWHDPARVETVPRSALDPNGDVRVGQRFEARTEKGIVVATVVALDGDDARVDTNHPLAGSTLHFDVHVLSVRPAVADEIQHGHVH
jgi:FKBP-type peptidyl-prolyl cis-trans isomerase SlyD